MANEKEKAIEKNQEIKTLAGAENHELSGEALDKIEGGGGNLVGGLLSSIAMSVEDALGINSTSSAAGSGGATVGGGGGNNGGQRTLNN